MATKNFFQRTTQSVSFKLIMIGVIALLLLIPANMVKSLIRERQYRKATVVKEITDKLGKDQTLSGPVLSVPYRTFIEEDEKTKTIWHHMHFLPETLNIRGKIHPDIRYRGIYKVVGYASKLEVSGEFRNLTVDKKQIHPEDIFWDEAVLSMGISDMRGIAQNIFVKWNNHQYKLKPGIPTNDILTKGVNTPIEIRAGKNQKFTLSIDLNGSKSFQFIPVGSKTHVKLSSDWNTPSFCGAFLPDNREVTEDGFEAEWQILELNRSYPQSWSDDTYSVSDSAFGVELIFPVDIYQKNMRSVKYALLFIILTFVVFFFAEYLNKMRIHTIQYLLVGFALIVFYSLLFALSEHLAFGLAYLIAAIAIISLITSFFHAMIKNPKATLSVGIILTVLYTFLYIVLKVYDYSLLLGNIGLFVVLAVIMYFSRKIDWNRQSDE